MKKFALELVFAIIGIPMFLTVFVIGVIYTMIKHCLKWDYSLSKQLLPLLRSVVLSFDGLANAGGGEMLNDALKIKGDIKYGSWHQTISAVTGLIKIYEKDTKLRVFLDKILGTNHCTDAINEADAAFYKIKQ